jgi:hypothetical protein
MKFNTRFAICTAALLLVLGITALAHARQQNGQEEHKQEGKPAQQQGKPAQQQGKPAQRHSKPAEQQRQAQPTAHQQQTKGAQPAQQQRAQQHAPAQSQHTQQAVRGQQPQTGEANRTQQGDAGRNQRPVQQTRGGVGNRGNSEHGRIDNDHYAANFGSGHSFRVNRGEYDSRRFAYGGYSFGFIDPWPIGWGYSDDVYVVYADGGYYMYDRVHPGVRISISIL